MGKERIIPVIALCILLLSVGATAYVYTTQADASFISINNQDYTIDQLFSIADARSFDDIDFSGIALDDLIKKVGIAAPETHDYTLVGDDG